MNREFFIYCYFVYGGQVLTFCSPLFLARNVAVLSKQNGGKRGID